VTGADVVMFVSDCIDVDDAIDNPVCCCPVLYFVSSDCSSTSDCIMYKTCIVYYGLRSMDLLQHCSWSVVVDFVVVVVFVFVTVNMISLTCEHLCS